MRNPKKMQLKQLCKKYISFVEALLWHTRHRLQGKQPKSIFLHSLFRSGSTYFFNKFRNEGGFWCYYEPLHHQLIELKPDRLDIFPFDRKTTGKMSHPDLVKPHFYEFKSVLHNGHIPFFNIFMSYKEFTSVRQHARTYKYIMTLLLRTPENLTPLLQFNRSSMRIGWFKRFFGNSFHVFILRNQRDQFESYFKQGKKYNIFLAINMYIIASNSGYGHFNKAYESFRDTFSVTHDLYYDLKQLAFYSGEVPPDVHYRVFMHIWVCSLIEAHKHADLIVDVDKLSSSDAYKGTIIEQLNKGFAVSPNLFSDCRVSSYTSYSMDNEVFERIEKEINDMYAKELQSVGISF